MLFVVIGVIMIALHFAEIGPTAAWQFDKWDDLLKFCVPFIAAAVWWIWADMSGFTKRRATRADEKRKEDRRRRNVEAMGLGHLHDRNRKR